MACVCLAGWPGVHGAEPGSFPVSLEGLDGAQLFLYYRSLPEALDFSIVDAAESDACSHQPAATTAPGRNVAIIDGVIRFRESSQELGCGEAFLDLAPPPRACQLVASFVAQRDVESTASALSRFVQQIRAQVGSDWQVRDYFDRRAGPTSAPMPARATFDIPSCHGQLTAGLSWVFADHGATGTEAGVAHVVIPGEASFGAEVSNVSLEFRGVPFEEARVEGSRAGVEGGRVLRQAAIHLQVPDFSHQGLAATVVVSVPSVWFVEGLYGARPAPLPDAWYETRIEGDQLRVEIPIEDDMGHGPFELRLMQRIPLSKPPVLVPVSAFLMFAPSAAMVLAFRNVSVYEAQARGSFRPAGRRLRRASYLVAVAYAVLVAAILFSGLLPLMRAWPMQPEQGMAYLFFVVIGVSFLALSVLAKRQETRTLGYEIKERERVQLELQRSNEDLERFAYVASHDLQEPLRMVASYTRLLQKRYKGQLDEDADTFIGYAVEGAERMQAMIHGLLSYSRVASRPPERADVDLEDVMHETLLMLESRIKDQGATVTHDPLPTVRGDRGLLAHVLQNLIGNGVKFRRDDPPHVHVSAARDQNEWRITVRDNGIGIAQRDVERVFEIFQRLNARDQFEGTGIGLALCQKIVARHGGRIWIESKLGEGTAVHFTLPERG